MPSDDAAGAARPEGIPEEPLGKLFLRFLRFGFLAWGGPVAQIAMIQQELVVEERWISRERFRRALAVYQVLPGPEAHELCVYFGMLSRGRIGGLLAGLGFMLPGFVLMFALSWLYLRYGLGVATVQAAFAAVQAAVVALIVRAVVRIGGHTLHDRWSWAIAALAALAQLADAHFAGPLVAGGVVLWLARARGRALAAVALLVAAVALGAWIGTHGLAIEGVRTAGAESAAAAGAPGAVGEEEPSLGTLAWSGLRTGLLTFGGAYTAIPFLQRDAVERGGWMTHAEFLDGLALSGILPAPLIIFGTFVGFLGGGAAGALLLTAGIFVPAFAFTMVGHEALERVVDRRAVRDVLDGVAAAVVGLIVATSLELLLALPRRPLEAIVFGVALFALFRWKSKLAIPAVIAAAAVAGLLASAFG
jgi:chromate transporter